MNYEKIIRKRYFIYLQFHAQTFQMKETIRNRFRVAFVLLLYYNCLSRTPCKVPPAIRDQFWNIRVANNQAVRLKKIFELVTSHRITLEWSPSFVNIVTPGRVFFDVIYPKRCYSTNKSCSRCNGFREMILLMNHKGQIRRALTRVAS